MLLNSAIDSKNGRMAIVTSDALRQLMPHDQHLVDAIKSLDISVEVCVWTDSVDWTQYDLVLARSPWDYIQQNPHIFEPRAKARFEVVSPSANEIALGKKAIQLAPEAIRYARVDMIFDPAIKGCRVVEVEAIEPMLYLESANASLRFAKALCSNLKRVGNQH